MEYVKDLVDKVVTVITLEGRHLVGTLKGHDQVLNLVLSDTHERIFTEDSGMQREPLGLYIVRGDSV
jgi:U6 snRNA-associated Sm-like protein LSm8